MIAWQCSECNTIYTIIERPKCQNCSGELEEIDISYDGEGLKIVTKNGEADG